MKARFWLIGLIAIVAVAPQASAVWYGSVSKVPSTFSINAATPGEKMCGGAFHVASFTFNLPQRTRVQAVVTGSYAQLAMQFGPVSHCHGEGMTFHASSGQVLRVGAYPARGNCWPCPPPTSVSFGIQFGNAPTTETSGTNVFAPMLPAAEFHVAGDTALDMSVADVTRRPAGVAYSFLPSYARGTFCGSAEAVPMPVGTDSVHFVAAEVPGCAQGAIAGRITVTHR